MKKLLFFLDTLTGGGAERVLSELVNHMDRERFDITVLSLWPMGEDRNFAPWIRYRSIFFQKSKFNLLRVRLEAALGVLYPLHIRGDYDIEVAYLEFGPTKILSRSTNKKAKKAAWVHCDLQKATKTPEAFANKAREQYNAYDKIVCVSENARDSFCKLFGREEDTLVLHNVVDSDRVLQNAALPLPGNFEKKRMTLCAVGRLSYPKNYPLLLRVHKRLLDAGLEHDLWILGEGEDRQELESYIRDNGLSDSVTLAGFQKNPYPFLREADLLVCSSRYEGLSTFITEGLILGKPIVTTDCSGMAELLLEGEAGVITENSEEGLYRGLKQVLDDPNALEALGKKSAQRGKAFYLQSLVSENEAFFDSL